MQSEIKNTIGPLVNCKIPKLHLLKQQWIQAQTVLTEEQFPKWGEQQ